MKTVKRFKIFVIPVLCIAVLCSCSYGFLNFTAETGSLELNLEFVNDNAKNIDKVKYELTPPKGFGTTISSDITDSRNYRSLEKMDTGVWSVKAGMYAGGDLVKEFSYEIEILNDIKTKLKMEARWNGSDYEINFQSWQDYNEPEKEEVSDIPDFSVTAVKLIPAYYSDNFTADEYYSVNVCILGSNLNSNVQSFELNYPDGYSFEYGINPEYSRSMLIVQHGTDSLIEVLRNQLIKGNAANGDYYLRLGDYKGVSVQFSETLSIDYSTLTPVITGYNAGTSVPATIQPAGPHNFGYQFTPGAGIGTRLVFLLNLTINTIEPPDDSMAVLSDTGMLNIAGSLASGYWEFIVASIGHSTSTPVTDASVSGINYEDLKSEKFASSIYKIYGENTGYVCYSSTFFIVP